MLERNKDLVVSFISSKVPSSKGKHLISVNQMHKEFKQTGLKLSSIIYLDKIATIDKGLVVGELGEIGKKLKSKINKNFKKLYRL